jgi:hypothetical protein
MNHCQSSRFQAPPAVNAIGQQREYSIAVRCCTAQRCVAAPFGVAVNHVPTAFLFSLKAPMAGHAAKKAAAAESKASAVYLALILLLNAVYIAVKGTV